MLAMTEIVEADTCATVRAGPATRDALFAEHAHWAATIGRQIHGRVGARGCDREDFVQNARMGLVEAIARYDAGRGIEFRQYAAKRVRGAVFNGLRAMFDERRPMPDPGRFAARLEAMEDAPGQSLLDDVVQAVVGLALGYLLEDLVDTRAGSGSCMAFEYANDCELRQRMARAVESLPARQRDIIQAHYYRHVPFVDLAARYRVTKGRISQQHHAALDRLRRLLRESD